MAEYDMDPTHLRIHEVNYELKIRGIATSSADLPHKRRFLRRELQKDRARPGVHVYETQDFSFEIEKKEIEDSLKTLTTLVNDFDGTNKDVGDRISSRLNHLRGRVDRIPDNISEEISGYRGDTLILISSLEDEKEEVMERHQQGDMNQPGTSTPSRNEGSGKSFPVHKWNLKFDGTTSGCSLNSFLEQVEELSYARNVSEDDLFRSAIELFEGPAKVWYRSMRSSVDSWKELVLALRKDFLSKDADDDLWSLIRSRKQQKDERVVIYIAAVRNLFNRLIVKATKAEQLKIIRKNLLEAYHVHLALRDILSIEQLSDICRALEDAGVVKATSHSDVNSRRNVASLEPDLTHLPTQGYKSGNGNSSSRKVTELRCFRCNRPGHIKRDCRSKHSERDNAQKKEPTCFGCGKVGVIRPNCPNCSKNGRAGDAQ